MSGAHVIDEPEWMIDAGGNGSFLVADHPDLASTRSLGARESPA
jgi:hypothetical protein